MYIFQAAFSTDSVGYHTILYIQYVIQSIVQGTGKYRWPLRAEKICSKLLIRKYCRHLVKSENTVQKVQKNRGKYFVK